MPHTETNDEVEIVTLALPLDRETVAWLSRMSRGNDNAVAEIVASMLSLIREDDEQSHRVMH